MIIKKYSNLFNFNIQNDIMIYTDPTTLEDNSIELSDIENAVPMFTQSRMRVASISEAFMSAALYI